MVANYPEIGEFVLANVNKIMPYGAFCTLDEYGGMEAFLHVSEVSAGWVKNIRDFVKEGQKIVAMVSRIDTEKRQIDVSLKRVSESDKRKKMESFQQSKRAEKLLERAAIKIKKNPKEALKEVGPILISEYGDLYSAFERIKSGEIGKTVPEIWISAIKEVADAEIKEKILEARIEMRIQCFDSDGVEKIRSALNKISKLVPTMQVHYIGAPKYYVNFVIKEFKEQDKVKAKMEKILMEEKGIEYEFDAQKG